MAEKTGQLRLSTRRYVGALFADVVIEEQHTDTLTITDHPVEKGSSITDHAYLMPPEVSLKIGWSASAAAQNAQLGSTFVGKQVSLSAVYEQLLSFQRSTALLDVSTGKRLYKNMLIKSIAVTTDAKSENALMVSLTLRHVFLASTRQTDLRIEQQADPAATAPVQDNGVQTAQPADQSVLKQVFG